jgi:dimethylargininase
MGLELARIDADDRYPDCLYVEDTAIVVGDKAFIAPMAAESRRGESNAVEAKLREFKCVQHLTPPATLDGGDVLQVDRRLYVGLSRRTNAHAIDQLRTALEPEKYEVVPVRVQDILHLKSACTYLGESTVVMLAGHLDEQPFAGLRKIPVQPTEAHAANCLALNGLVLIPAGAPETRARIEEMGFETEEIDISESRKAAGGLTCSSIVF